MTLNYALVYGKIKLVLYDDRKSSSTYKKTQEIVLSKENYCLVTVPPLIWNGFKSLSSENSILTELEENNVLLNYSCRQGHCGSCILRLVKGDVIHQECLVPLSQGEILACQSKPVTDIKITAKY